MILKILENKIFSIYRKRKIEKVLNLLSKDEIFILKLIVEEPYISKRKIQENLKKKYIFYSMNKLNRKIEKLISLGLIQKVQYKRKWKIKEDIIKYLNENNGDKL